MARENFVSLKEIAARAGVSISAVSLALRNSPKVSAQRRRMIQKTAAEMGYRQDPRITELMEHLRKTRKKRRHSQLAILIPELTRDQLPRFPRVPAMISGIREIATSAEFGVDILHLADPGMNSRTARSILLARGIKGLIVAPFASGVAKFDFNFDGFCAATAGYSIIQPSLHRACPDYLKMMDGMLAMCTTAGYQRIGLVMTKTGGIGFKLFTSSFLFFQSNIKAANRVPMLTCPSHGPAQGVGVDPTELKEWLETSRPDVVIGAAPVLEMIRQLGIAVPAELGFVSIDVAETPGAVAGADHCYEMVGQEAFKLMHTSLNLNITGVPDHPRVVMIDSQIKPGSTLLPRASLSRRR